MGCAEGAKRPARGALSRGPAAGHHVRRRRLESVRKVLTDPRTQQMLGDASCQLSAGRTSEDCLPTHEHAVLWHASYMTSSPFIPGSRTFFAYGGQPSLLAEGVRDAIEASRARGVDGHGWENLRVEGAIIIDKITNAIDGSDACVAEVSTSNPNVLFEAGYALAKGKKLLFAIDETDETALHNWNSLSFIQTIGRINYSGNSEILADILAASLSNEEPALIERLLSGARPLEENAIFAPGALHKFNTAEQVEQSLQRKTALHR